MHLDHVIHLLILHASLLLYDQLVVCLGLQFRIKGSQERCPSFTYASLPGVTPTPIEWKMCCDPDCDVGSEHVTYHILTDSDKTLSSVIEHYLEEYNIVGLVIVNNTNSTSLSNDIITRYIPPTPPVYVVSSGDGERLSAFVKGHDEGAVQIKVLVESAVDFGSQHTGVGYSTLS